MPGERLAGERARAPRRPRRGRVSTSDSRQRSGPRRRVRAAWRARTRSRRRRRPPRWRSASTASWSRRAGCRPAWSGDSGTLVRGATAGHRQPHVGRRVDRRRGSPARPRARRARCRSAGSRGRPCGPGRGGPRPRSGAAPTRPTRCSRRRSSRRGRRGRSRSRSARSAGSSPRRSGRPTRGSAR